MIAKYLTVKRMLALTLLGLIVVFIMLPDYGFHGRVIDQYGQPVVNAQVRYEGTHSLFSAGGGLGAVHTDEEGYFKIETDGNSLVLAAIIHPEIEYSYPLRPQKKPGESTNSYAMTRDTIGFRKTDKEGRYLDSRKYESKRSPFVIHAWRLGQYEGAIKGWTKGGFPEDGSVRTLRFSDKYGARQVLKGAVDGQLRVSCRREPMARVEDYGDWSVTISPVNGGGIQETDDLYMNMAPETGYLPSLTVDRHMGSSTYLPRLLNKRYYFTSNDGQDYGSLYVHYAPFARTDIDGCNITFYWKLNTTGSRNLEHKK